MTNREDFPATLALAGLAARTGAAHFESGYLDDDPAAPRWWCSVTWKGRKLMVDEQPDPEAAADALAVKLLLSNMQCARCRKMVNPTPLSRPIRRRSCVWHRVGDTWCAGCDPEPAQNQPTDERPYNDMRPAK